MAASKAHEKTCLSHRKAYNLLRGFETSSPNGLTGLLEGLFSLGRQTVMRQSLTPDVFLMAGRAPLPLAPSSPSIRNLSSEGSACRG